jgi:MtfA peptidase
MTTTVYLIIVAFIFFYLVLPEILNRRRAKLFLRNSNNFSSYELKSAQSDGEYFAELVNILKKQFPFYNKLTENERRLFATRTYNIRRSKSFYGMESFVMLPEHETLISATITQLTFGLTKYYDLPSFELIQVYPSQFYSKIIDQNVKGLTLGNGRIIISWRHFEEGHEIVDDKVHLGLHEFAHAMMIEFDHFRYASPWSSWKSQAEMIMPELAKSETHFFRKYGATNIPEFWAVSVETFFEQPKEFRYSYPEFYNATAAMLNQDLCARMEIFESI